jgi:hypothetical protein
MQRSEFELLQEAYGKVNENKNPHHADGIILTPKEVRHIQYAIHSNNILKGITKVFKPNDFITPLSEVLAKVGFELDTPVQGFQGSYGTSAGVGPETRLLRIRKKDHNNTDPYTEHPLVSEEYQIHVTASWLGREGHDEQNYDRPMYEIIAYLTA